MRIEDTLVFTDESQATKITVLCDLFLLKYMLDPMLKLF